MKCLWCSNSDGMSFDAGKETSPDAILAECISCKPMFFSGGGVTFTGGEASLQHAELIPLLKRLQENGIHTALETNATSPHLPEIARYIDYLIMDFKHHDSGELKKYTGVGNENIKKNFEHFCSIGRQLHVRIPLINHVNTADPEAFAQYFSAHNTKNVVFEFFSYHEYGKEKWTEEYKIRDGFVSRETLDQFHSVFKSHGLKITKT